MTKIVKKTKIMIAIILIAVSAIVACSFYSGVWQEQANAKNNVTTTIDAPNVEQPNIEQPNLDLDDVQPMPMPSKPIDAKPIDSFQINFMTTRITENKDNTNLDLWQCFVKFIYDNNYHYYRYEIMTKNIDGNEIYDASTKFISQKQYASYLFAIVFEPQDANRNYVLANYKGGLLETNVTCNLLTIL